MSQDIIIEKIKKLLRMKRGGTLAEIETALNLARELANKHGIDIESINPDEQSEERRITMEDAVRSGRLQWEAKYAMLVCQQFFNVTGIIRSPGHRQMILTFIGTSWDIQIAIYIFRFLCGHFRREWNTKRGRCRNRQAFMYGMYHGLCSKLDEKRKAEIQEVGLMRIDQGVARRDEFMKVTFPNSQQSDCKPDGDAEAAKRAGYLAGRQTEIRQGVTAQTNPALMLNV